MTKKDREKKASPENREGSSAGGSTAREGNPPFEGGTQIISGNSEIEATGRPTMEGGNSEFTGDSVTSVLDEVPPDAAPRNRRATDRERETERKNPRDKDAA